MKKQDLQQISELMDQKLKENNKRLKEEIVDEVGAITNQCFGEFEEKVNKKFDKVNEKFDKVNNDIKEVRKDIKEVKNKGDKIYAGMQGAMDNQILDLNQDMDKVKYIHRQEWHNLPPQGEISRTLVGKGMKSAPGK